MAKLNILHDDNKCIITNGQMIINIGDSIIYHMMIIQFGHSFLELLSSYGGGILK